MRRGALLLRRHWLSPAFGDEHARVARRQREAIANLPLREIDPVDRVRVFTDQAHRRDLNSRRLSAPFRSRVILCHFFREIATDVPISDGKNGSKTANGRAG